MLAPSLDCRTVGAGVAEKYAVADLVLPSATNIDAQAPRYVDHFSGLSAVELKSVGIRSFI